MTKPEDINAEVWMKAEGTLDTMLANHGYEGWRADSIATIARAILSAVEEEREACAKEAEKGHWQHKDVGFGRGEAVWVGPFGPHIASAIRNRKES